MTTLATKPTIPPTTAGNHLRLRCPPTKGTMADGPIAPATKEPTSPGLTAGRKSALRPIALDNPRQITIKARAAVPARIAHLRDQRAAAAASPTLTPVITAATAICDHEITCSSLWSV